MDYQIKQNHVIVNCGSRMDIATVEKQLQLLKEVLDTKKPIILNASDIESIDTAALQLLVSFTQTTSQQNIIWEWQKPSLPLLHMANLLGLRQILLLPEKGTVS